MKFTLDKSEKHSRNNTLHENNVLPLKEEFRYYIYQPVKTEKYNFINHTVVIFILLIIWGYTTFCTGIIISQVLFESYLDSIQKISVGGYK